MNLRTNRITAGPTLRRGSVIKAGAPQRRPLTAAEAEAKGRRQVIATLEAVFASKHVTGREAVAAELVAEGLSAKAIIATLTKIPKVGSAEMLTRIGASISNPDLKPGSDAESQSASEPARIWSRAFQQNGWKR